MLSWPLKFLVVVLIAVLFDSAGRAAAGVAKILAGILLIMFLTNVIAGRRRI